jgi:hypothetical protein
MTDERHAFGEPVPNKRTGWRGAQVLFRASPTRYPNPVVRAIAAALLAASTVLAVIEDGHPHAALRIALIGVAGLALLAELGYSLNGR